MSRKKFSGNIGSISTLSLISVAVLLLVAASPPAFAAGNQQQAEDYALNDYESLTKLMHNMKVEKNLPDYRRNAIKGDLSFSRGNFFEAQKYYKRCINDATIRDSLHLLMKLEFKLLLCFDRMGDFSLIAHSLDYFSASAQKIGDQECLAAIPYFKGKVAYYSGQKEEGFQLMEEAIRNMKNTDAPTRYEYLLYFYNNLVKLLQRNSLSERALKTLQEMRVVIDESRRHENTSLAFSNDISLKEFYGMNAITHQRLGREEEAAAFFNKFLAMSHVQVYDYNCIESYLFEKHLYDEVIKFGKLRLDYLALMDDTLNSSIASVYRLLAKAYERKNMPHEALTYYHLMDHTNRVQSHISELSAMDELSANYSAYLANLDKQQRQHDSRVLNMLVVIGIVAVIVVVYMMRTVRYNRIIKQKNVSLVRTIDELMEAKAAQLQAIADPCPEVCPVVCPVVAQDEALSAGREDQSADSEAPSAGRENPSDAASAGATAALPPPADPVPSANVAAQQRKETLAAIAELQERRKFERMNRDIIEKRLYLDPALSRMMLLDKYNIPRNNFSSLFQKYVGTSYSKYINNLRLEQAAKLLKEQPNYTIESVANDCGISSVATLYRLFSSKYGMTPTEYRQTILLSQGLHDDIDEDAI